MGSPQYFERNPATQVPASVISAIDANQFWFRTRGVANANEYDDLDSAVAINISTKITLVITDAQVQTANTLLTIPGNITVAFGAGGSIVKNGTGTLHIENLQAGSFQIFSGFAPGDVTLGSGVREILPQWWGATGDDINDDTAAFSAALEAAAANGGGIVSAGNGVFRMTATLTVRDGVRFLGVGDSYSGTGGGAGKGTVLHNVSTTSPAITIEGDTGYGFEIAYMHILGTKTGGDDGIYLKYNNGSAPRTGRIHNISIKYPGRDGFRFDGYSYIHLHDIIVQTAGQHGYHVVDDSANPLQEYLWMAMCRANACGGSGFHVTSGTFIYLDQCDLAFNYRGLFISGNPFQLVFNKLSISQNISQGIEIYANDTNLARMSFRDTFILMKGSLSSEKAIYVHRAASWVVTNVYFDWAEIARGGAITPVTSIDLGVSFADSGLTKTKDSTGGAFNFSSTQPFEYSDTQKMGLNIFPAGDTTPTVLGGSVFRTNNSGATTISMFDGGILGQKISVIFTDNNTTIDFTGTNLKGNAGVDWSPIVNDHMTCVFNGSFWFCDISDNTA